MGIDRKSYRRQRGIVLLTAMLIALSASSYVVLKALNNNRKITAAQNLETRAALAGAKQALIGYAVGYPDDTGPTPSGKGPGYLPCPDHLVTGPVGSSDTVPDCNSTGGIKTGRFPWRTLGMEELTDEEHT